MTKSQPRPRQARALATRQKLLDATAASLCDLGYASTTTTTVVKRAGVSQGALFKHFGTKGQLIAEAMAQLLAKLFSDFRFAFSAAADEADPLARALPHLWSVFLKPELYAVVELYLAARNDEELRLALEPALSKHRENIHEEARRLFPVAAKENKRFNIAVDGIMATLQGAAITAAVVRDFSQAQAFAKLLESICRRELDPPYGKAP